VSGLKDELNACMRNCVCVFACAHRQGKFHGFTFAPSEEACERRAPLVLTLLHSFSFDPGMSAQRLSGCS
jgi:hypothetical protein